MLGGMGIGVQFLTEQKIFLFPTGSRPFLGPNKHYIHWIPTAVLTGVERLECEADSSTPSSADVKNV
jgi:hypothetical protein